MRVDDPAVQIVAVKRAQSGEQLIVRLLETSGTPRQVQLRCKRGPSPRLQRHRLAVAGDGDQRVAAEAAAVGQVALEFHLGPQGEAVWIGHEDRDLSRTWRRIATDAGMGHAQQGALAALARVCEQLQAVGFGPGAAGAGQDVVELGEEQVLPRRFQQCGRVLGQAMPPGDGGAAFGAQQRRFGLAVGALDPGHRGVAAGADVLDLAVDEWQPFAVSGGEMVGEEGVGGGMAEIEVGARTDVGADRGVFLARGAAAVVAQPPEDQAHRLVAVVFEETGQLLLDVAPGGVVLVTASRDHLSAGAVAPPAGPSRWYRGGRTRSSPCRAPRRSVWATRVASSE